MAESLNDIIAGFGAGLARVAASYERNPALREELRQDMYMALISALPRLRDPQNLRAYVFRIAHNCGVRHVIRRTREKPGEVGLDEIASDAPTQEQSVIDSQRSAALLSAVRKLALPYRQVITLVLEDLTYAEIAEALGISEGNVAVRVNRAKLQLRSWLRSHG
jgi:RNA polymerase sigma factor (sigma-70 family)